MREETRFFFDRKETNNEFMCAMQWPYYNLLFQNKINSRDLT